MKRLRHPVRAIREPFGTAGLVVACVALIAALGGTALAAAKLNSTQKKEVEKIAKKFAGKPGAPGAPGAVGPQGSPGANGKDGLNGTNGTDGKDGENGTDGSPGAPGAPGKSVESFPVLTGATECGGNGGAIYEIEGEPSTAQEICNGKEGEDGEEGSPWTKLGTLPPGATETGTWAFNGGVQKITVEVEGQKEEVTVGDTEGILVPISFPIPFPFNIKAAHVHYVTGPVFPGTSPCAANGASAPKADPGELCIYQSGSEGLENATFGGAFKFATHTSTQAGAALAGATLRFDPTGGVAYGAGSFAVTGCTKTVGEPFECPAGS